MCIKPLNTLSLLLRCIAFRAIFLVIAPTVTSVSSAQNNDIPRLGEPADQVLPPGKEREIGQQFYQQVRNDPSFIVDAQVNHYIQSLGERLVNRNDLGNNAFTFFVLDDTAINAFAVPGGYIGLYRGLIDIAKDEGQLASVIAHEIAHVTQRHLARLYAKQQGISLASTAAVIAGIIASTQGNVQAGSASIYAGIAAGQQSQINFTRDHESEADRIGIQLLANGQYNTTSMALMFTALQRASLQGSGERFEFLRTHPLSSKRIAEARSQAQNYNNADKLIDSLDFELIKARLDVISSDNLPQLQRHYKQRLAQKQTLQILYGLALIHQLLATPEKAVNYIEQLSKAAPQSILVQLLQANNLIARDKLSDALPLYARLHGDYPLHYPIIEAYTQALTHDKRHKQANVLLQEYLFGTPQPQTQAYKLLAFHQQKLGQLTDSRINMAHYFVKGGMPDTAFSQLKLALREPSISDEDVLRINAKLEELKQIRLPTP